MNSLYSCFEILKLTFCSGAMAVNVKLICVSSPLFIIKGLESFEKGEAINESLC